MMFLDEKLYQHVKNRKIDSTKDFMKLVHDLHIMCRKVVLNARPRKNGKLVNPGKIMEKVVTSWDTFVGRLKKENHFLSDALSNDLYHAKTLFDHDKTVKKFSLKNKL